MNVQISVYIRHDQALQLKEEENQSQIVREALDMYFTQKKPEMLGVDQSSLEEAAEYLDLDYVPEEVWVENFHSDEHESLRIEWSDGNQIHSTEANMELNEVADWTYKK